MPGTGKVIGLIQALSENLHAGEIQDIVGNWMDEHDDQLLAGKADKTDTVLDTTLSRGRKENEIVGTGSFAFGNNVIASGNYSHAEGLNTSAMGANSHTSGMYNVRDSYDDINEWVANTQYTIGDKAKITTTIDNVTTVTAYVCAADNNDAEFTEAHWTNLNGVMHYAEIVGNGSAENSRSNARALDWEGNEYLMGDVYVECNPDSTGGTKLMPIPTTATSGQFLMWNGSAWVASSLPLYNGGVS